jgi:RND family efflux transporter MFP subunit
MPLDHDALDSLKIARGVAVAGSGWRSPRRWLAVLALIVLGLAAAAYLGRRPPAVETALAEAPAGSGRVAILNASGYVVARRTATVASKVTGRVVEVLTEEGRSVASGEVLARLDATTATRSFEVAQSQAESARRALAEIRVRLADAERMLARNEELIGAHLVAQSALDTSRADVEALKARLEASRAEVGVAEAGVRARRQDLDDLVIRAPFAGVVISRDAQPGEMVSPISAGGGFTRTGIATVVDMTSREIEVDVNEAYIQRVHAGQPAEATLDAYPDWTLPAHVIAIVPAADRQKATVKVRIGIDKLEPRILPDMGVKVRFLDESAPAGGPPPVALVPAAAVSGDGAAARVRVVADGVVHARPVVTGARQGEAIGILSGVKPGERVVVRAPAGLADGARVAVADAAP